MNSTFSTEKPIEVIIYGAYGSLGQSITQHLLDLGIYPLLAGRNKNQLKQLAQKNNLPYVCFDLINTSTIEKHLRDAEVFINCVGSLISNPEPIARAAMKADCHYLDIGGQYHTLTTLYQLSDIAKQSNSVICAGIGAECLPGDCLASAIKHNLKTLNQVEIAYDIGHHFSAGSLQSTLIRISHDNIEIDQGSPLCVPYKYNAKKVLFGSRKKMVTQITTGDLAAIQKSCKTPNIKSYFSVTRKFAPITKVLNWIPSLFSASPIVLNNLNGLLSKLLITKSAQKLTSSHYWAKGVSDDNRVLIASISAPDIYKLTENAVTQITLYLLKHERSGGIYTPSELMTWKFMEQLPGCSSIRFGDFGSTS